MWVGWGVLIWLITCTASTVSGGGGGSGGSIYYWFLNVAIVDAYCCYLSTVHQRDEYEGT